MKEAGNIPDAAISRAKGDQELLDSACCFALLPLFNHNPMWYDLGMDKYRLLARRQYYVDQIESYRLDILDCEAGRFYVSDDTGDSVDIGPALVPGLEQAIHGLEHLVDFINETLSAMDAV